MQRRINNHNQIIAKKRYKMYKAGKNWFYAPIIFLGIGVGLIAGMPSHTAADEIHNTATASIYTQKRPSSDNKGVNSATTNSAASETATSSTVTSSATSETANSKATTNSAVSETANSSAVTNSAASETANSSTLTSSAASETANSKAITNSAASETANSKATTNSAASETANSKAITNSAASETANSSAVTSSTASETANSSTVTSSAASETANSSATTNSAASETANSSATTNSAASETANSGVINSNAIPIRVSNSTNINTSIGNSLAITDIAKTVNLSLSNDTSTISSQTNEQVNRITGKLNPNILLKQDNVANVSTAQEFHDALFNGQINQINLQNDISLSTANVPLFAAAVIPTRSLTINGTTGTAGKYYTLDWQNNFVDMPAGVQNANVKFTDINLWAASWWGPIHLMGSANDPKVQSLTFNNVNYYGSQMISSYGIPVFISGDVNTKLLTSYSYKSPVDGSNVSIAGNGVLDQEIFESSNVEVLAGANFTGTTAGGTAVVLAPNGVFKIDQGATVNLSRATAYGANETGTNALIYTAGGSVIVDGTLNLQGLNMNGFSGIFLAGTGVLTVSKSGVINYNQNNADTSGNKAIYITGAGTVNDYGTINIKQNGQLWTANTGVIQLDGSGTFVVGNGGFLNVDATNLGSQNAIIINLFGTSNFNFEDGANVTVTVDGNGQVTLLETQGANSVITMYHAHKVVFDLTQNTNPKSSVFYFVYQGNIKGQLQKIIYNTPNAMAIGPYLSFNIPMLNSAVYQYSSPTAQGMSLDSEKDINSLAIALSTTKYLEFVTAADNKVNIEPAVTDHTTVVTGKTLPEGFITLTDQNGNGITGLPAGTLVANRQDTTKYMAQADSQGNWSITLPAGFALTANTILRAVSSLNYVKVNYDVVVGDQTSVDNNNNTQSNAQATSATAVTLTSSVNDAASAASAADGFSKAAQSLANEYSDTANVKSYANTAMSAASVASTAASTAVTQQAMADNAAAIAASAASVASIALKNEQSATSTANEALSAAQSAASAASAASYANDSAYKSFASAATSYAAAATVAINNATADAKQVAIASSVAARAMSTANEQQSAAIASASTAASAASVASNALLAEQQAIGQVSVDKAKSAADSTNKVTENTKGDYNSANSSATTATSYSKVGDSDAAVATSYANLANNAASEVSSTAAINPDNQVIMSAASAAMNASSTATSAASVASAAASIGADATKNAQVQSQIASSAESEAVIANSIASTAYSQAILATQQGDIEGANLAASTAIEQLTKASSAESVASLAASTAASDAAVAKSAASTATSAAAVASQAQATAEAENNVATSTANAVHAANSSADNAQTTASEAGSTATEAGNYASAATVSASQARVDNGTTKSAAQDATIVNKKHPKNTTKVVPVTVINKTKPAKNIEKSPTESTHVQKQLPKTDEQAQTATILTIIGETILGLIGGLGLRHRKEDEK
ncbi:KxYKxGKxW signal peptide domain-containing protein [Periweissella fabaria]|uniref:Uncharacterized protein n=1 Tax=Periweissella fabaria TaxID=546157 RepID=A0ABN8BEP9_9LACO|nr:KxYKxGKxW signal peptide domain-containing protein [Periweissella fabaria]MCM0597254.1 KxYKxGKxW signal peptide domain-containing protein [Periweissella fabaria]CAH0416241.1 hypothetical protein WFA24289_00540 [Periweissella fabaria]